jgi:hypothetical protein
MPVELTLSQDWVPDACTLPTLERPLRAAEFEDLFAQDVVAVVRESPQEVRLELRAESAAASRAARLAVKETACCAFFAFDLAIAEGSVSLRVGAAPAHEAVLAALADRAEAVLKERA